METLVNERGLSPRDAFQRFVAPPLRLVVRVKGGQDLSAPVDGEIGSDESGIWWRSGRSLLAVFASSRGRLVGLAIRNSDGVEIASKRYRPAIPLPVAGSIRTVTVESTAIKLTFPRDERLRMTPA